MAGAAEVEAEEELDIAGRQVSARFESVRDCRTRPSCPRDWSAGGSGSKEPELGVDLGAHKPLRGVSG